ncbi:MAG: isoleucine--tRNA ligase [Clostridia bacterium]
MYNKVDSKLDFVGREEEIVKFWKENDIQKSVRKQNENNRIYSFYEGPPTANGIPHIGHVLTRTIKDVFLRYHSMLGENVIRKGGFDTHGLPVELEVEKKIGSTGKKDIETYGINKFLEKCKENTLIYQDMWEDFSNRMGYSVDMEDPYITFDVKYMESVWWSLAELYNKGYIYQGHRILPYCPRCGTSLSTSEVAQGYKTVKERSCVAKFKALDEDNTFYLAWTTTPWTLPSNVALCMNAKEDYVKIKTEKENYILAKNLVDTFFEKDTYSIVYSKKGSEFEKRYYEPLFDFVKDKYSGSAWFITNDDYVTLTDGTGVVHIAPAFGEDDAKVGKKYKLPFVQLVAEDGKLTSECGQFAGLFIKDADRPILINLKETGKLFKDMMYEHEYPHCWRCETPLLYYARSSWFIKTEENKEILISDNKDVEWFPESVGEGRMGGWFRGIRDWDIGRNRYWGTPLPIWICKDCGHVHAVGSVKELKERGGIDESVELDLHKPTVDKITFKCEKCGGVMTRTPEVIDCWYDSGSMPFAELHYPFENKELFEKTYPCEFISEGMDQTRGWFYALQTINSLLFGKTPYKRCLPLGLVNDEHGIKMSKHLGNVVSPFDMFKKYGTDAVRWYFYTANSTWISTSFKEETLAESQRKMMGTLWNTYSFFVLYANIDNFDGSKTSIDSVQLSFMDKWIISEVTSLTESVRVNLDAYNPTEASRAITKFIDTLSNWYVRRSRERFWSNGENADKTAAFTTLYYVLNIVTKLLAPFTPLFSETIYQNLVRSCFVNAKKSIHMCSFPVVDEKLIDKKLNEGMESVLDIVVLGRSARNSSNQKNRQPLRKMMVALNHDQLLNDELISLIKDEINIQNLEFSKDLTEYISYDLKPQLKTVGPKYGKQLNIIRNYLSSCDSISVVKKLNAGEELVIKDGDSDIVLGLDDVLINACNKEGYSSASASGYTVVLDTIITPELKALGEVREFVSKIQALRKEADFEVVNHINLGVSCNEYLKNVIISNKKEIMKDTLADNIYFDNLKGFIKEVDINEFKITIAVEKN